MNSDQLHQWGTVYKQHLDEFNAHKDQWANDRWREPFQLLGAALVYTHNAIAAMPAATVHKMMRTAIGNRGEVWEHFYSKNTKPLFCSNTDENLNELFSTMHLASSSFRLATALFLIHETRLKQAANAPLFEFVVTDDWNRTKLLPHLQKTKNLQCCQKGHSLNEKTALAAVLAHRDEFGHGEEASGGPAWRRDRSKYAETFPLCRIVEAQLILASLGIKELSKI